MATYVKFRLEDGTDVYIESADSPRGASGLIPSRSTQGGEHEEIAFAEALAPVQKMAAAMMESFRNGFSEKPSEVNITFGLKASNEVNTLVVTRAGVDVNYNVSLRWDGRKESEKEEEDKDKKK